MNKFLKILEDQQLINLKIKLSNFKLIIVITKLILIMEQVIRKIKNYNKKIKCISGAFQTQKTKPQFLNLVRRDIEL